jgi:hypothetical protein
VVTRREKRRLCDICLGEEQPLPGSVTWSGVLQAGGDRQKMDLCEAHELLIVRPLLAALRVHGVTCPICWKACRNRPAMVTHLRRVHKQSITELEERPGIGAYACNEKDCGRTFETSHQLGAHVWNDHRRPRKSPKS